jgi:hypothetical protein
MISIKGDNEVEKAAILILGNLTPEQLDTELEKGYQDYKEGRVLTAAESYDRLKKEFKI